MALAQHTAVSMAKTADWAEGFVSQGTLILETEAGAAWTDAAVEAHRAAMAAATATAKVASQLLAKAQSAVRPHIGEVDTGVQNRGASSTQL